jgi:hypothetical protein
MARKSPAKKSARKASPRVIRSGKKGGRYLSHPKTAKRAGYREYVKQCKGSARKDTKGMNRVVHVGPRGGKYCIVGGKKRYL